MQKQKQALFNSLLFLTLFFIILPLTLVGVLNRTRLWSKADDLPVFPISRSVEIANPGQEWSMQFTGENPDRINTEFQVEARNCKLYDINDCTAPVTIAPWRNPDNTSKMMSAGRLQNQIPQTMPLGKIYFAKYKPYNSLFENLYSYSPESGIGVSPIPTSPHTDEQIRQKYIEAVNAYLNRYPVNTAQGITVRDLSTMGSVESSNRNPDYKADHSDRVMCGETKVYLYRSDFTLDQFNAWHEDFAKWRGCIIIASHLNNIHTIWQYLTNTISQTDAREKITRDTFMLLANFEMLLTGKGGALFTEFTNANVTYPDGTPNANYTLGDANWAKEYATDFGMGVLKSIGWAKSLGIIDNQYCSHYMGTDNACTNVNIQQMVRKITQQLYNKEKAEYDNNSSWKYDYRRSRHLAGMAMAAKLNAQKLDREDEFITLAGNAIASNLNEMDVYNFSAPNVRIPSDLYQHHETFFTIKDWQPVSQISDYMNNNTSHTLLKQYYKAFYKDNQPIFELDKDSYNLSRLQASSPDGNDALQIANCKEKPMKFWHKTANNKVMGLRGEPPSSALLTSLPALLHISESVNPYANADLKNTLYATLEALKNDPNNYNEEICAGGLSFGHIPFTPLLVTLRNLVFQVHGYLLYTKTPIGSF